MSGCSASRKAGWLGGWRASRVLVWAHAWVGGRLMVWASGWATCWLGRADYWAGACAWVGRRAALAWAALAGGLGGQLLAALEAVGRAGGWASVLRFGWRTSRKVRRMPFPHAQHLSSQWALSGSGPRLSLAATCAHGCALRVARHRVSPGAPANVVAAWRSAFATGAVCLPLTYRQWTVWLHRSWCASEHTHTHALLLSFASSHRR